MTIFDALRYQISDIPTSIELVALPDELFKEWVGRTEWYHPGNRKEADRIGDWYENVLRGPLSFGDKEEIALLRKMIAEWEE